MPKKLPEILDESSNIICRYNPSVSTAEPLPDYSYRLKVPVEVRGILELSKGCGFEGENGDCRYLIESKTNGEEKKSLCMRPELFLKSENPIIFDKSRYIE